MRLGQLARKLSLRPSQLVDFLSEKNIETQEGSNTRLEDLHVEWIVQEFAPERLEEILNPVPEEKPLEVIVEEPAIVEPEVPNEVTEVKQEQSEVANNIEPTAEIKSEEPEVIRVQKIELSGLKVLGKIELPEPKKKEIKTDEGSADATQRDGRKSRSSAKSKHPRRERDQRNLRNPIEAQRQREAREREEKRKADQEREKEKRKHHYQNKVKQLQQPKRAKPVKETTVVKKPIDKRPVPKTWLGKFLRWWTT